MSVPSLLDMALASDSEGNSHSKSQFLIRCKNRAINYGVCFVFSLPLSQSNRKFIKNVYSFQKNRLSDDVEHRQK